MTAKYECDKCGACCKALIIEIGFLDILREPSLRDVTKPFRMPPGSEETSDPFEAGAMLACGSSHPCPKLGVDNLCTIYPTRPNDCVGMQAGDEQCQMAREMMGLLPLAAEADFFGTT